MARGIEFRPLTPTSLHGTFNRCGMPMGIKIKGTRIDNVYRVANLSADTDFDFEIEGSHITNAHTIIEVRDRPGLLGLPENTPPEHLLEALRILRESASKPIETRRSLLNETQLFHWLGPTADIVTIGTAMLGLLFK